MGISMPEEGPRTVRIPEEYIQYYDATQEQHINCSACKAPLFDIIPKHESKKVTKIIAECPHCGDKSFQKTVEGEFYFGNTEYTVMTEPDFIKMEMEPNNQKKIKYAEVMIYTRKVKKWN
jgi:DNA-directed RNA polymerase subunit RPC12/RpoP